MTWLFILILVQQLRVGSDDIGDAGRDLQLRHAVLDGDHWRVAQLRHCGHGLPASILYVKAIVFL